MNTKPTTTVTPLMAANDLQALADEIAATTGATPAAALELAAQQRPALRQYAARWNAMFRRSRAAAVPQRRHERHTLAETEGVSLEVTDALDR